jgi:hypothetical protein
MAAAVFPEALRRVQAELDEIVGRDRCEFEAKEAILIALNDTRFSADF